MPFKYWLYFVMSWSWKICFLWVSCYLRTIYNIKSTRLSKLYVSSIIFFNLTQSCLLSWINSRLNIIIFQILCILFSSYLTESVLFRWYKLVLLTLWSLQKSSRFYLNLVWWKTRTVLFVNLVLSFLPFQMQRCWWVQTIEIITDSFIHWSLKWPIYSHMMTIRMSFDFLFWFQWFRKSSF